ncbi:MAG TPA: acetyl-CoA carboxylase biotin carboxyl carrier protein subunit [Patescibacteria group bacterium]|nr:acetyl-CoA carboxylase biotin carboxyl carrier protein subunit [Patescibacteria group bacterium]
MSGSRQPQPTMISGPAVAGETAAPTVPADPRAVRVGVAPVSRLEGDPALSIAPTPDATLSPNQADGANLDSVHVDGVPVLARLNRFDDLRARLDQNSPGGYSRTRVLFGPAHFDRRRGTEVREVVVEGWRIEVELEPERRALLRERARHSAGTVSKGGPVEVRAIIPGRVVVVSVGPGDGVEAGEQILVVEAMKMQNELRAPREGIVERVEVTVGDTIEVGDLLVVIR